MGERRRLRVLAPGLSGDHRFEVCRHGVEHDSAEHVEGAHQLDQPIALADAPAHRAEVAGTASEVDTAADVVAKLPHEVLLARVHPAADLVADSAQASRLHLA